MQQNKNMSKHSSHTSTLQCSGITLSLDFIMTLKETGKQKNYLVQIFFLKRIDHFTAQVFFRELFSKGNN